MSKKMTVFAILTAVLAIGALAYAADYQVSGLSFSGVMASSSDSDNLHLQGQEGLNPTICLNHAPNVDFEFEVFNNGTSVARNTGTSAQTCSTVRTPGTVRIRVWSFRGSGPYSVSIRP